jgi:Glycosyltransferase family 10 (fucosyltransferase) C-term
MRPTPSRPIRVKLIGRVALRSWLRQFPGREPVWDGCAFIFDRDARDYDWLVVYEELAPRGKERLSLGEERLACPRARTLLVTTEPSAVKTYGDTFAAQFGWVLTSQEPWALRHPGRIYSQPALRWFYGVGAGYELDHDALAARTPPRKVATISTVCSEKRQTHTLHRTRFDFTARLKAALPELEVFGRGVRDMDDKAEALDHYRYHVAIENHVAPHHWTEKLADAFLGFTLPLYHGCPNAAAYFPEESFIPIDIRDPEAAIATIRRAIREGEYERRLPAVIEARRRVLDHYNLFAVLAREIGARHDAGAVEESGQGDGIIRSRRAFRRRHPLRGARDLLQKVRLRAARRAGRAG